MFTSFASTVFVMFTVFVRRRGKRAQLHALSDVLLHGSFLGDHSGFVNYCNAAQVPPLDRPWGQFADPQ